MPWTATLRGVTIGAGTNYRWATMPQGLGTVSRQALVPMIAGGAAPSGRDVGEVFDLTFEVHLLSTTPTGVQTLRDALVAAWAPSSTDALEELTLTLATGERIYRGRPRTAVVRLDMIAKGSMAAAQLVFTVMDPRWYGGTQSAGPVSAASSSGGMDTPMVTPMVTTGSGSSGDTSVTNNGTASADWTATITGGTTGVVNPRLILGGRTILINGTIPAGGLASVSSATRTVTLDGQPRPWVSFTSDWWQIPPGQSTFSFRTTSGDGVATLTWRDASY